MILFLNALFEQADGVLYYKPYASFPTWRVAWDVSTLIVDVPAIEARLDAVEVAVVDTYEIAVDALELATEAAGIAIDALNLAHPLIKRVGVDASEAFWISGGGFISTLIGTYRYGYVQFSTANPNERSWSFECDDLPTGLWYVSGGKSSASGKGDFYVDGVHIGQVDFYNSTTINFQEAFAMAGSVVSAGLHKLTLLCNSKNASSSGYALPINRIWFVPASGD